MPKNQKPKTTISISQLTTKPSPTPNVSYITVATRFVNSSLKVVNDFMNNLSVSSKNNVSQKTNAVIKKIDKKIKGINKWFIKNPISKDERTYYFNDEELVSKTLHESIDTRVKDLNKEWRTIKKQLKKHANNKNEIELDVLQNDFVSLKNIFPQFKVAFESDFQLSDRIQSQQIIEDKNLIIEDNNKLVQAMEKVNKIVNPMIGKLKFQISAVDNKYLVSDNTDKLQISAITSEGQCQVVNLVEIITNLSFKTKIFNGLQIFMKAIADKFLFESNKLAVDIINLYKGYSPNEWMNYKLKILSFESQLAEFYGGMFWSNRAIQLFCENKYSLPHSTIVHPVIFNDESNMPILQAAISHNHNFIPLVPNITNYTNNSGIPIYSNQSNDSISIVSSLAIGGVLLLITGGTLAIGYCGYKLYNKCKKDDYQEKVSKTHMPFNEISKNDLEIENKPLVSTNNKSQSQFVTVL